MFKLLFIVPNKKRQNLIDKTFLKFSSDGDEEISIRELKTSFNYNIHPLV